MPGVRRHWGSGWCSVWLDGTRLRYSVLNLSPVQTLNARLLSLLLLHMRLHKWNQPNVWPRDQLGSSLGARMAICHGIRIEEANALSFAVRCHYRTANHLTCSIYQQPPKPSSCPPSFFAVIVSQCHQRSRLQIVPPWLTANCQKWYCRTGVQRRIPLRGPRQQENLRQQVL